MKKNLILSSEYSFAFLYFIFSILIEVISLLTLSSGELFLPKYLLFDLTFILIVCGIFILARNKKFNTILFVIVILLQVVLNIVNAALFKTFGYIFNFDMAKLGAEAARAFEPQFVNWLSVAINVVVFALAIFLVVCINKKVPTKKIMNKFSSVLTMFLVVFILQTTGLTSLLIAKSTMVDAEQSSALYVAESDVYLYDNMQFTMEAYKKFGVFGFYVKNL